MAKLLDVEICAYTRAIKLDQRVQALQTWCWSPVPSLSLLSLSRARAFSLSLSLSRSLAHSLSPSTPNALSVWKPPEVFDGKLCKPKCRFTLSSWVRSYSLFHYLRYSPVRSVAHLGDKVWSFVPSITTIRETYRSVARSVHINVCICAFQNFTNWWRVIKTKDCPWSVREMDPTCNKRSKVVTRSAVVWSSFMLSLWRANTSIYHGTLQISRPGLVRLKRLFLLHILVELNGIFVSV